MWMSACTNKKEENTKKAGWMFRSLHSAFCVFSTFLFEMKYKIRNNMKWNLTWRQLRQSPNTAEGLCLLHPSHKGLLCSGSFPTPVECWMFSASSFLGEEVRTPQNSWGHWSGRLCAVRYLSTSAQKELPLIWEQAARNSLFLRICIFVIWAMTLHVRNGQSSPLLAICERSSPNASVCTSEICVTVYHRCKYSSSSW